MKKRILEQAQFNQQTHFYNCGYLKFGSILNNDVVNELREFVYKEKELQLASGNTQAKIYGLYDRNPELMDKLVRNKELIRAVSNILGPNIIFVKNRHNQAAINSKTDTKTEARLHRDILQPSRGLLTVAVYLEDSTIANGATNVIPGSHTLPSVGVPQQNGGGTWMDEHQEYDGIADQAIPISMKAGDVLLFNGMLFHSVGNNTTNKTRASIILGFRSNDELDDNYDEVRQLIVSGENIYRGNDK